MNRRIDALDLVRGVVMVLMAIDHVRCYSGQPAGGATASIFFTRWVTHFCAPAFAFFAGTGAFLYGRAVNDPGKLARYLVTRGLWLCVLELTVVRFSWTFNLQYSQFMLFGVIWMLGCCMVLLAGLVRLPPRTVGLIGVSIVALQQVFSAMRLIVPASARGSVGWMLNFVYPIGGPMPDPVKILYTIVPWVGVMAAGHAFGAVVVRVPVERHRFYRRVGFAVTALFLVYVGVALAFMPGDGEGTPRLFLALNPPKYPASQAFLAMTLGPTIVMLPIFERVSGWMAGVFTTFGRVPLFYYLLHIPAIHFAAIITTIVRGEGVHPDWYATAPFTSVPEDHMWSLPLLYLVFAIVVVALYFPCRWYAGVKARNPKWWMRYI